MNLIYIVGFFLGGALLSYICNELLLRFSRSLGIRNKNDVVIRWSNESKPSLGGVSFFVVFIFAAFSYAVVDFDENIFHEWHFVGLFFSASLAFAMGLADDAYNTQPISKLSVQILCGVILLITGTTIQLFHQPILDGALTIIWVVVVMNSLNMLDNMDGITGTTVLFILLTCLFSHWMIAGLSHDLWTLTLLAIIGSVLGFLKFNIHPSKLFMGDAGSQFIGLFAAYFSVHNLWNVGFNLGKPSWLGLLLTLIAFTPAAADTLTVVINRLKKGQSPMVGGKDHTTHFLVYSGLRDFQVWMVFLIIGFGSCLISVLMIRLIAKGNEWLLLTFLGYFVFVFAMLYRNTLIFKEKLKK